MQYKGVPTTLTQSKHTCIHNTHIQNTHTRAHVHPLENNLGIPGSLILHQQFYKEKTCLSLQQPTSLIYRQGLSGAIVPENQHCHLARDSFMGIFIYKKKSKGR